jgi:uncharacterized protein (DUF885 family)
MRRFTQRTLGVLVALAAFSASLPAPVSADGDSERFREIYEREWAFRLREFPMFASYVGVHDYDDRLGRVSETDQARRHAFWKAIRAELDDISCVRLGTEDCINYRVFVQQMDNFIAAYETRAHLLTFNSDWGFFMEWARLPEDTRFGGVEDYRNYLARLHQLPDVMDEYITLMRQGLESGMTQPRVILSSRDEPIRAQLVDQAEKSTYYRPFADLPESVAGGERAELLALASYYAKKIDGRLPLLFGHLPRQPYGVAPVPDDIAPFYTAGRYVPAPLDALRGGYYWVNTHALESRPLYAIPALTLHEGAPGHHTQGALALEQTEQPPFRRFVYISAYGEGWGLYAEKLGLEMDIYETPYEHFGRLTYEMWRACRLVIDTGIHAFGWTRRQALDYLASNTALSMHEVTTEIDRYISWPAQALSYKLGEYTILRLRREAEQELGPAFDVRAFHDHLLSLGSVPLDVLSEEMTRWVRGHQ